MLRNGSFGQQTSTSSRTRLLRLVVACGPCFLGDALGEALKGDSTAVVVRVACGLEAMLRLVSDGGGGRYSVGRRAKQYRPGWPYPRQCTGCPDHRIRIERADRGDHPLGRGGRSRLYSSCHRPKGASTFSPCGYFRRAALLGPDRCRTASPPRRRRAPQHGWRRAATGNRNYQPRAGDRRVALRRVERQGDLPPAVHRPSDDQGACPQPPWQTQRPRPRRGQCGVERPNRGSGSAL